MNLHELVALKEKLELEDTMITYNDLVPLLHKMANLEKEKAAERCATPEEGEAYETWASQKNGELKNLSNRDAVKLAIEEGVSIRLNPGMVRKAAWVNRALLLTDQRNATLIKPKSK